LSKISGPEGKISTKAWVIVGNKVKVNNYCVPYFVKLSV